MNIKQKLKIDLLQKQNTPRVYAVQNDANTRGVELNLFSGGFPWVVPDGVSISVAYRKPDKTSGWYDKLPDGSDAYSVDGNAVTITFAPQVMTVAGLVKATVIFQNKENLNQIAVFPFDVVVEENPASGNSISNSYYNYSTLHELNEALGDVCVGWDGTIYPTAGQAVRGQFNEFNMQMEDLARTVEEVSDCYYETFSKAIADINGGIRTGKCNIGEGAVKVVTGNTGKVTVILLEDCYEAQSVTISADVDIALAGHGLIFTESDAQLILGEGTDVTFWGNTPGSRVEIDGIDTESAKLFMTVNSRRFRAFGGDWLYSGAVVNHALLFKVTNSVQECVFEDCRVTMNNYASAPSSMMMCLQNACADTRIIGGTWTISHTDCGYLRAASHLSSGKLTIDGAKITVEGNTGNIHAIWNENHKGGTVSIVAGADIRVNLRAGVYGNMAACTYNGVGGTLIVDNSVLFSDAPGYSANEERNMCYALALLNYGKAYLDDATVHGTHSGIQNCVELYINGGTYTGFCHGGIYFCHGPNGVGYVNDAILRDGHYEGSHTDVFDKAMESYGGFYVGGYEGELGSNMDVYLDGCTIEGVYRALVMRGSDGEQNNKAFLSNCTFISGDVERGINIHDNTNHLVYLGEGCNYTADNATHPEQVVQTNDNYRRVSSDKTLDGLDFDVLRRVPRGGEVDPEAIEDAVEKYLTENPPAGGAGMWEHICDITTTEQIDAGIEVTQNSDGVPLSELKYNEIWIMAKMVGVETNTYNWWESHCYAHNIGVGQSKPNAHTTGALGGRTTGTRYVSYYHFIRGNKMYRTNGETMDVFAVAGGEEAWLNNYLDNYMYDYFEKVVIPADGSRIIGIDTEIRILGRRT